MPLRTVFIDAGGTLIQEIQPRAAIYAAVAAAHGRPVGQERMAASMRAAHKTLPLEVGGAYRYSDPWFEAYMEQVFHRDLGIERGALPGIARELFERFSSPATFKTFPGAFEFLDELDALGVAAAVVSNWSGRLPGLLAGLGLGPRLAAVLTSADERCEKPSPELFRRALARTGTAPEEALHTGDHPEQDVAGARAAGIEAVLMDHQRTHGGLRLPRVEGFRELGRLVRERCA
jgi:putative hydrolase of the HAD superfamily